MGSFVVRSLSLVRPCLELEVSMREVSCVGSIPRECNPDSYSPC